MTADLQTQIGEQILDIVREHGPIDLSGICDHVTLTSDRSWIAAQLFNMKRAGDVERHANKKYTIKGAASVLRNEKPKGNGAERIKPLPNATGKPAVKQIPTAPNRPVRIEDLEMKPGNIFGNYIHESLDNSEGLSYYSRHGQHPRP